MWTSHLVKISIVDIESFCKVLLRDRSIWIVKNLSIRSVILNSFAYCVGQLPARVHTSEQNVDLRR